MPLETIYCGTSSLSKKTQPGLFSGVLQIKKTFLGALAHFKKFVSFDLLAKII